MKAAKQLKRQHAPAVALQKKPQPESHKLLPSRLSPGMRSSLPLIPFFAVYFLCLWKWVNVGLIYHGSGQVQDFPSFYWGWNFTQDFRTHPGGAAEYVSALLAQSLYSPWFGAMVLTFQAVLAYLGVVGCLRLRGAGHLRWVGLIAPLLFLAIYSKYRHYSVAITSFTAGVVISWGWMRWNPVRTWLRLALTLIVVGCLYAAVPNALIVFVPAFLIFELRSGTGWLKLLGWLCFAALVPRFAGAILFGFAPGEAYARILPVVWDPVVWKLAGIYFVIALYAFPVVFCTIAVLLQLARKVQTQAAAVGGPGQNSSGQGPGFAGTLESTVAAVIPLVVVFLTINPQVRALMRVDYFAWNGRWPEVLDAAKGNPRNVIVACTAAQASYHTGTLTQALPNLVSAADLLLFSDKQQSHWKKSDLYFDLGYVNMALHHLTESVEFYGERPPLLRRLAMVNLALTNLSTAKVYLGTLARAPFQSSWARDYLELLKVDPTLDRDEEVSHLRRLMVKRDSVVAFGPDEQLLMLLNANRQNRMAFEYLMTYYLMTKDLDAFVKQLARVQDFPGFAISPMWDEALVLASRLSGRPMQVPGHVISSEAFTRVETVTRLLQQYKDDPQLARHKLSAEYGQTYTFYFLLHE